MPHSKSRSDSQCWLGLQFGTWPLGGGKLCETKPALGGRFARAGRCPAQSYAEGIRGWGPAQAQLRAQHYGISTMAWTPLLLTLLTGQGVQ
ncbi:hypothetical protein P7K49_002524 [Saguinus oedipus]|uniref:Uncharacterized protein n=1 Tax=Saguinus oedipus TaxID=9490 RepID=A0ABQ9WHJ8_SAGOE|nr:hypothetical protein P7K49_002524 [Saguinus oedipus]